MWRYRILVFWSLRSHDVEKGLGVDTRIVVKKLQRLDEATLRKKLKVCWLKPEAGHHKPSLSAKGPNSPFDSPANRSPETPRTRTSQSKDFLNLIQ